MTRISKALNYHTCRYIYTMCSQCNIPLHGKPSISKRMSKRVNKKHTKYYCVQCALWLHVLTPQDARKHGITILPEESP